MIDGCDAIRGVVAIGRRGSVAANRYTLKLAAVAVVLDLKKRAARMMSHKY